MADRSVYVRLKGDVSDFNRAMLQAGAGAKAFTKELDTSTDRSTNLVQSLLAIGPAVVPIGAAAVPAISGLTNQLAFAAAGAGVAALAFAGVGDALKAVNEYSLDGSSANYDKMAESMAKLGPAGREFVGFLQEIRPQLQGLQDAAQDGLFPGAEAGITSLMELLPQAERIISNVSGAIGDLIAEAGDNLSDARWQEFFTFLENEARPTLIDMGRTLGNFAEGFANVWMAFDPLSDQFSHSFLQMSRDFAAWTDGLAQTQGFQEFVDYIQRVGPQAWETLGALGNALLQIVEAAAPVGEAVLPVITALANTLAAIADSPVGPILIGAAAGISAISRAVALYQVANGSALTGFLTKTAGAGAGMRAAGAAAGILALSLTDLDESIGLSNTASFALMGSVFGPWGTAAGAAAGFTKDLASANDDLWSSMDRANASLDDNSATLGQQSAAVDAARAKVEELKASTDGFFDQMTTKGQKNYWEGVFGRSDVEEANSALKDLEAQQAENTRAALDLAFAEAGLGNDMSSASDETSHQIDEILQLIDAHNKLANELLGQRGGLVAFEQAIDDATAAAKKNGNTLDINTQAGRDNDTALRNLAQSWNDLTPAQQTAAGASKRAREEFISAAIQMGRNRTQAGKLADKYLELPSKAVTDIILKEHGARGVIAGVENGLAGLNGDKATVYIHAVKTGADIGGIAGQIASLNRQRKASGGYISGPGTGTSDSIPAMLSNGEYVINAAATRNNLALLHAINSAGKVQRFADGGSVAPASISVPQSSFDYDRLEAIATSRPIVVTGKLVVNGRDAGTFYQEGAKFAGRHK